MASTIIKIRSLYNKMGRGEKKIADYILEHQKEIISLSISELSAACDCGDATVVRFSRRLGLSGYQALKINIAQETTEHTLVGIEKDDSCSTIFEKRIGDLELALENTKNVLNSDAVTEAANSIMKARQIVIFGLGSSAPIALDAQNKFLRVGLNVVAYTDNHLQAVAASHLTPNDVAIAISHSGSSTDVVSALKIAHECGAKTVAITKFGTSPILRVSDIVLFTNAEETKYSLLPLSSRIAQLTIIDTIYSYITLNDFEKTQEAIRRTEQALLEKKY